MSNRLRDAIYRAGRSNTRTSRSGGKRQNRPWVGNCAQCAGSGLAVVAGEVHFCPVCALALRPKVRTEIVLDRAEVRAHVDRFCGHHCPEAVARVVAEIEDRGRVVLTWNGMDLALQKGPGYEAH